MQCSTNLSSSSGKTAQNGRTKQILILLTYFSAVFLLLQQIGKKKIHWLPLELIKLRGWALIALIEVVTVVEEESEVEAGVEAEVVAVVEVVE